MFLNAHEGAEQLCNCYDTVITREKRWGLHKKIRKIQESLEETEKWKEKKMKGEK